jgi:demethylmenaquinone methyltransferase/2-methoxy-6-polyprenyl-1,4-benzoquinol methylase
MKDDMVGYYARRAAEYERVYAKPERQSDIREFRQLLSTLFLGRDLIEVSCGTGYWTEVIAPGARSVTACDINEAVLAIARAKDWSNSRVEFHRADSYALPDFGRTFSGGFSGFWWSHIPKERMSSFLVGFHALLAKGALVAFVDNRYVEGSSTAICRTDSGGNTFQSRRLDDGSVHEVLKNFPSKGEIEAALGGMAASIDIRFLEYYWLVSYRVK